MNAFGEKVDLSPIHCDKFAFDDVFSMTKRQRTENPIKKNPSKKLSFGAMSMPSF